MANNYKVSSRFVLIYFEFRSKPPLITVICMDPRPTNYLRKNIFFSCPEMIRVSFSFFLSFSVFCYFTLLLVFKKIILLLLLLLLLLLYFFHENYFYFFMFRHVPECSVFRVLSTPVNIEWVQFVLQNCEILLSVQGLYDKNSAS